MFSLYWCNYLNFIDPFINNSTFESYFFIISIIIISNKKFNPAQFYKKMKECILVFTNTNIKGLFKPRGYIILNGSPPANLVFELSFIITNKQKA